jgi:hypothetical protein
MSIQIIQTAFSCKTAPNQSNNARPPQINRTMQDRPKNRTMQDRPKSTEPCKTAPNQPNHARPPQINRTMQDRPKSTEQCKTAPNQPNFMQDRPKSTEQCKTSLDQELHARKSLSSLDNLILDTSQHESIDDFCIAHIQLLSMS